MQRIQTVNEGFNGSAAFFHTPKSFFLLRNAKNSVLTKY